MLKTAVQYTILVDHKSNFGNCFLGQSFGLALSKMTEYILQGWWGEISTFPTPPTLTHSADSECPSWNMRTRRSVRDSILGRKSNGSERESVHVRTIGGWCWAYGLDVICDDDDGRVDGTTCSFHCLDLQSQYPIFALIDTLWYNFSKEYKEEKDAAGMLTRKVRYLVCVKIKGQPKQMTWSSPYI